MRTKIVATIGPATHSPASIDALIAAGMSVARINCAHGGRETQAVVVERLRARAAAAGSSLAVLADLAGPKIRIGKFVGGSVELAPGDRFTLTPHAVEGDASRVTVEYPRLAQDVHPGHRVFLADGLVRLIVREVRDGDVHTEVEAGGRLGDRKGLAVPGVHLDVPILTPKDLVDLDFLADAAVEYIGLSFVRTAAEVERLREELRRRDAVARVVAKIETAEAVANLDEIARAADAVMVARGDLGVECPIEEVPLLQKRIVSLCNRLAVPVITATQMLESMTDHPYPTRAEASDVANAVIDGTDAVMLSAETATGRYPIETVRTMCRILTRAEQAGPPPAEPLDGDPGGREAMADAVARSACMIAESVDACAIVCLTQTDATARYLAKWRPRRPIYGVTPDESAWRRLSLVWGVEPLLGGELGDSFNRASEDVLERLRAERRIEPGRTVVLTAGVPFAARAPTNTIRVERA